MLTSELLNYLFDGQPHLLTSTLEAWLASSRRFNSFVTNARDKIRKKLRVTQDQETLQDLRLELETAYLLLREPSFSLVYEPQQPGLGRCPDFAVSFTTRVTFMLEVTRLHTMNKKTSEELPPVTQVADVLADTICGKLGQLLAQRSNILIVGMDLLDLSNEDLEMAMLRLKQRAEGGDVTVWQRHRLRDRADFFKHYQRLSEVLVRATSVQRDAPLVTWVNAQAKYPLPGRVRTALYRSHTMS